MAENFPNLIKKCYVEDAEIQWGPSWIYIKRTIPKHILLKLLKTKNVGKKKTTLKAAREKRQVMRTKNIIIADFLLETMEARRKWNDLFLNAGGERVNPEFYIQGKYFLRKWRWNKICFRQIIFRKIFASRSAFEEMLKDVFSLKVNNTKWKLEFIVRVKRTRHDPLSIRAGWLVCRCLSLLQPVANIRKIDIRTKVFPTPC